MVLQRQVIDIPLGGGLQTKLDPKVVPPGSSLVLENAEFDELGAISKRNGYDALSKTVLSGSAVDNARAVFSHRDELLLATDNDFLSWSPTLSKWVSKAGSSLRLAPFCATSEAFLPASAATGHQCDFAIANGIAVFAYRVTQPSGSTSIYVTAIDTATGTEVISAASIGASGTKHVRVIASGDIVFICTDSSGSIAMTYVDTSAVTSLPATTNIATTGANDEFELGSLGDGSAVLAYTNVATTMSALIFTTSTTGTPQTVIGSAVDSQIGVTVTAAGEIFFAFLNNTSGNILCRATSSDLATPLFATATLAAGAATDDHIVGVETSTDVVTWVWNTQVTGTASSAYRRVKQASINNAGTVTVAAFDALFNHHLLTRPWVYDGAVYVGAYYAGATVAAAETLQPTSFVWRLLGLGSNAPVVGKLMSFISVDEDSLASLDLRPSSVGALSSGVYWFGGAGSYGGLMTPARLEIDFTARPSGATVRSNLLISGGMPLEYDGAQIFEQNFNAYPEIVDVDQSASGGSLSDGAYQVAAVFVHVDGNGNVHRSAPSTTASITLSGGGSSQRILVYLPSLASTRRTVRVEVYCTEVGGSTLYLAATNDNNTSGAETTVTVNSVDPASRIIYTNGGILENSSPPALVSIASKSNRAYGVTREGVIWYTKEVIDGEGAAYVQDTTVVSLPSQEIFALAALDDALYALGQKSFFAISGEGLDDTGASSTLSEPASIAIDDGALEGSLVLSTDMGIWFKSRRGLCLLSRSRSVEYVGAPVEDFNDLDVVSAVIVPTKGQLRFGHSDGATLVFDYNSKQWSVFTNHNQVHAAFWDGKYVLAQADGDVWTQSTGFTDGDGASITMTVETPWIKLAGIQGFHRLYYVGLQGEFRSSHTCTVTPYLDYSQTAGTPFLKANSALASGEPLDFRHHLGNKCKAVKFRLVDSNQAGTKESYTLTALSLELGGKGGIFRQSASKTV